MESVGQGSRGFAQRGEDSERSSGAAALYALGFGIIPVARAKCLGSNGGGARKEARVAGRSMGKMLERGVMARCHGGAIGVYGD